MEKNSDSETVEVLLNDLLNKVTAQSSFKKPKKKRRLSLQKHSMLSPCKPVTSGSKKDVARNVVKVSQTKEGKKFMITTGV